MSDAHKEPNYLAIFYLLGILTALEIGAVYLPIPHIMIAVSLVLLALVKATLVALYFMHLKYEKRLLGYIALTPLLLCTFLIMMLLPDLTGSTRAAKSQKTAQIETPEQVVEAENKSNEANQ